MCALEILGELCRDLNDSSANHVLNLLRHILAAGGVIPFHLETIP